jgi:hypothetical protein
VATAASVLGAEARAAGVAGEVLAAGAVSVFEQALAVSASRAAAIDINGDVVCTAFM